MMGTRHGREEVSQLEYAVCCTVERDLTIIITDMY